MTDKERVHLEHRAKGKNNKRTGEVFEYMLEMSINDYAAKGLMAIKKTPEPMKPIKAMGKPGQFLAHYIKPAQVDFCGTLAGGRAIRFEAKYTDTDRFTRDRLTDEQMQDLEIHERLGAYCCVMLGFGKNEVYRIPWLVWKNMKQIFGRSYVTRDDIKTFRVPVNNWRIELLSSTEEELVTVTPDKLYIEVIP